MKIASVLITLFFLISCSEQPLVKTKVIDVDLQMEKEIPNLLKQIHANCPYVTLKIDAAAPYKIRIGSETYARSLPKVNALRFQAKVETGEVLIGTQNDHSSHGLSVVAVDEVANSLGYSFCAAHKDIQTLLQTHLPVATVFRPPSDTKCTHADWTPWCDTLALRRGMIATLSDLLSGDSLQHRPRQTSQQHFMPYELQIGEIAKLEKGQVTYELELVPTNDASKIIASLPIKFESVRNGMPELSIQNKVAVLSWLQTELKDQASGNRIPFYLWFVVIGSICFVVLRIAKRTVKFSAIVALAVTVLIALTVMAMRYQPDLEEPELPTNPTPMREQSTATSSAIAPSPELKPTVLALSVIPNGRVRELGITFLTDHRGVPYYRDGKQVGLRLFGLRQQKLLSKLGLRDGDVVMALNGVPVTDIAEMQKVMLAEESKERKIVIDFERNFAPTSITVMVVP